MMTRSLLAVAPALLALGVSTTPAGAFVVGPTPFSTPAGAASATSTTALQMGLFDGVKDAFSAPALERSTLDSERETPIDRWMGWSVVSDKEQATQAGMYEDIVMMRRVPCVLPLASRKLFI